jgi:HEAT repeat protein
MKVDVTTLIHWLNGAPRPPGKPEGIIPPYLEPVYDRISAARELRNFLPRDQLAIAALLRAAIVDEEEDVRKMAILALVHGGTPAADTVLVAAAFYQNHRVRLLSLEGLDYLRSPSRDLVARLLLDDEDPEVTALATDVVNHRAIQYYELEAL